MNTPRLVLSVAVAAFHLFAAPVAPVPDYASVTNRESVVATPVGYQQEMKLITGETVRTYPTVLPPAAVSNCTAVLFCILSPDDVRGKYFLLEDSGCRCYMCEPLAPWPEQYKIGSHYLFPWRGDLKSEMFELGYPMGQHGGYTCLNRLVGFTFPLSVHDVDAILAEMEKRRASNIRRLEQLKTELAALPAEPRDQDGRRERLKIVRPIRQIEYATNSFVAARERYWAERDRLSRFPGGAISNRVEPLRYQWNGEIRKLDKIAVPGLGYSGMTLSEILEYLNQRFNPNQDRETLFYNEILFEGNYPSDVTWIRPYTVTVPAGSLLDALLFLGGLEHVRLDVKLEPTGGHASFIYFVTDDPAMFDWSDSEYARILPDVEEKEMTLEDAAHWVSDAHEWGRYQCEINDTSKLKARHRLAFGGKSLREVIRLIEVTFDVRYDYREQCWRDPVK